MASGHALPRARAPRAPRPAAQGSADDGVLPETWTPPSAAPGTREAGRHLEHAPGPQRREARGPRGDFSTGSRPECAAPASRRASPPSAPGGQPATPVRARLSLPPPRISIIDNHFISAHGRFHSVSGVLVKSPRCLPRSSNLVDVTPNRSSQHQLDTLLSPLSGHRFLLGFLEPCSSTLTSGPARDLRGDCARCRGISSVWLF